MASGNTGKQLEDAMSYLETQVRGRTMDKEWRDHVRFAWDVSPTLAVYLPQVSSKPKVNFKQVSGSLELYLDFVGLILFFYFYFLNFQSNGISKS